MRQQQTKASTMASGTGPVPVGLASDSALAPLREPLFRDLWAASVVSNFGTWMQNVGAAWLMTTLTPSPLLIALMTAATSLPMCLLGLPAGALADLVDRRRLLLVAQGWMLLAAGLLGVLTLAGLTTPWTLLALTFALGLGGALNSPAWQAITPEIVNRRRLGAAVALNSAGFNLARAVGPAAGGLVVAALGPAINFLLNAASFLATIVVLFRWQATAVADQPHPGRAAVRRDPGRHPLRALRARAARRPLPLRRLHRLRQRALGAHAAGRARSARPRFERLRHPARRARRGRRGRRRAHAPAEPLACGRPARGSAPRSSSGSRPLPSAISRTCSSCACSCWPPVSPGW